MAITFYEGAAGTGKTWHLFAEVERRVTQEPLVEPQRILVFSRMHGARRKLLRELRSSTIVRGRFECETVDAFAWRLVRRWRQLLRSSGETLLLPAKDTYAQISAQAALLMQRPDVATWFQLSYRFVVLDEGQDCRDGQLALIQAISQIADLVVAGDEFQDLVDTSSNPCLMWLRTVTLPVMLDTCHRTKAAGLLAGAHALRTGKIPTIGKGLTITHIPAPAQAAHYAAAVMSTAPTTILFPTGPQKSSFVAQLIARLEKEPLHLKKSNKDVGPFTLVRERGAEEEVEDLLAALQLPKDADAQIEVGSFLSTSTRHSAISSWADRQRRLRGVLNVTVREIRAAVEQAVHERRSRGYVAAAKHRMMTIHQAKNQQFDRVLVLWPYQVAGDAEHRRRLLYNAFTRARHSVTVIIQGEEKDGTLAKLCATA